MKRIVDLKDITTKIELHKYLKDTFYFPDYYGNNLDALYDLLSEITEDTVITIINYHNNPLDDYIQKLIETFIDAAKDNTNIYVVIDDIPRLISGLTNKYAIYACECCDLLCKMSNSTDDIYQYMNDFFNLLKNKSSFVRNRALVLIANNSKWDIENIIDANLNDYLIHLNDIKPITVRVCIANLKTIYDNKPYLKDKMVKELQSINYLKYPDSMLPLIQKDAIDLIRYINEK